MHKRAGTIKYGTSLASARLADHSTNHGTMCRRKKKTLNLIHIYNEQDDCQAVAQTLMCTPSHEDADHYIDHFARRKRKVGRTSKLASTKQMKEKRLHFECVQRK